MTLAQILARLAEIKARNAAIVTESRAEGISAEKLAALAEEQEKLLSERASLQQNAIELRDTANGADFNPFMSSQTPAAADGNQVDFKSFRTKDKLAYVLGKQLRGRTFTDVERRELGKAITTTATEFVAATASVDGVNNAGIFIDTKQLFDLLREEGKLSPIFADISFTHIKGLVEFPYRKSRDKANVKTETQGTGENQMEWAKLTGVKGWLQTVIVITDEVKALTDFDLGSYIIEQMLQDLNEDWCEDLIYGTGADDHIKGVTFGATAAVAGGYTGEVMDAIIAGIKLCKGKYRRGAKVYVAQDVYDDVFFAVDDNGNFKYPVLNNAQGIVSVGPIRLTVDENLKGGDFIVGNVTKYFKANALLPVRLETERAALKGTTSYVASEFCATCPVPGAIVYGSKKPTSK